MIIIDALSWICLILGCILCIIGGLGLLRLPDFYSRMHGGGVTDTLGAGLVLLGLMFQGGLTTVTVKLAMILALLLLTSPTSTHAVGKAALTSGLKPFLGNPNNKEKNEHD